VLSAFELFVAGRYLRARRKEKVISVITVISIAGVAAGVMALVISLAVNNGFRDTLQRNLLGATAHINIVSKDPGQGIGNWRELIERLRQVPHVVAIAPVLYDQVFINGAQGYKGVILKGIDVRSEISTSDMLKRLKSGSLTRLTDDDLGLPAIILGAKLASDCGLVVNNVATVISPEGKLTPYGPAPKQQRFRVVGIFESGFGEIDQVWAYAPVVSVQKLLSLGDVVNSVEIRLDDLNLAPRIAKDLERLAGNRYTSTNWQDQNKELLHALKMERVVTAITIGLIELVGALNILITLTMIVLTKYKDIAVLLTMGARRSQIRRIFVVQGAMIGAVGTLIGLSLGYLFCYFADKYRLIPLDEAVYALSFVPFQPRPLDAIWIAAAAMTVSLLATLYPARNATQITPVEVLRYE
jgi:lipoprotein-releasing system permease protein